jgi:alcohol dehydrogenase class IV
MKVEQKIFRNDDFDKLRSLVSLTTPQNIFLVRDKASYNYSGANNFIGKLIDSIEQLTIFEDFTSNPKLSDLENGISVFRKGTFSLIIAIGGGSTLDMAKLISVFSHQDESYEDLVTGKRQLSNKKTAVLAIPTTAGSGAEATQFSVLYIDKTKHSVEHPLLLPDYIYLSSAFTLSTGQYLTACSGLDAFCQAIESIWSIHSDDESESYAIEAVRLVWHNLHKAFLTNEISARERMQEAAFLSGKAINITKTTAPHALSYAFTSYYNIPHGHAVALSLPFFLDYNYNLTMEDCNDSRGPGAVKERINRFLSVIDTSITEAPGAIINFFNVMNINMNIHTLIHKFDPSLISRNVNLQRLNNNPRKITSDVIVSFLSAD